MSAHKKIGKKIVNSALFQTKRVVSKNPRIKRYVRNAISRHVDLAGFQAQQLKNQLRYTEWAQRYYPDGIEQNRQRTESAQFSYKPLISIITPTYNTDIAFLKECIESVQSQTYQNWELVIIDDASPNAEVRDVIKEYAAKDERIKHSFNEKNLHISGSSNIGIGLAKGEFISLLDHDDILWPNALFEVAKALNKDKTLDLIYSDEDKTNSYRWHKENPFFKPDWNPDFLRSVNYITHFTTIRKSIVDKVGGFESKYDGAQDWDLFLKVTHETQKIHHIPTVLYSWRMSESSTAQSTDAKPYVTKAQQGALTDDLIRQGYKDAHVEPDKNNKDYWTTIYPVKGDPLVSIVIPTKDQLSVVKRCVESILQKSTYNNYEIIMVDTGSTDKAVRRWYDKLIANNSNIKIVDWPEQPFSYSRSCNEGAKHAKGEYLLMLNNDTEVITTNWIELLLGDAQREKIGAVGCKLYYPGGELIQHAGIGIGFGGLAANSLSGLSKENLLPMQHLYANTRHDVSAVTAACLMISAKVFKEVSGFDEQFRVTYNDVDLCLRLREAGYRILYTPTVELLHHESISVGLPDQKRKRDGAELRAAKELFKTRWAKYIANDPHLNPNIVRTSANFEVKSVRPN